MFRRMFNKTNEEAAPKKEPVKTTNATSEEQPANAVGYDMLDPTTQPVSTKPVKPLYSDGVTQRLNSDLTLTTTSSRISFGLYSDVGLVRPNNQDAALSYFFTSSSVDERPDFGLFMVADGMGGHRDGEKASAIATRVVASHLTNTVYLPILIGGNSSGTPPITEALISAVQKANQEIIRSVPDGGTTLTALAVLGDLAYIAHVGDSRAYLITKDSIEQVTRDHSLVQRLIELDQMSKEDAHGHQQGNVLYRALGQNESVEVDTLTRRLQPNSRILICSDGLWNQVKESDLFEIAMNNSDPQQACEKLVALANTQGGGPDNITVILLRIS